MGAARCPGVRERLVPGCSLCAVGVGVGYARGVPCRKESSASGTLGLPFLLCSRRPNAPPLVLLINRAPTRQQAHFPAFFMGPHGHVTKFWLMGQAKVLCVASGLHS